MKITSAVNLICISMWFLIVIFQIRRIACNEFTDFTALELGFEARPKYIPNNAVVLTFDDAPDYKNTAKVLDILKNKTCFATFFINTNNWGNVIDDQPMQELIRRIVDEGHTLGSHTASHPHLSPLSEREIENELTGVELTVEDIMGANAPRVTLFRAPYGEPYQTHNPRIADPAYEKVAPIVARHAVHIGWNVDSKDYGCKKGDGDCVLDNIKKSLKTPGKGNYGIVIMHCVHSQTVNALAKAIDYIRANGFVIWSVEDVVHAKYGAYSEQLIYGNNTELSKPLPKLKESSNLNNF